MKDPAKNTAFLIVIITILAAFIAYGGYEYYSLKTKFNKTVLDFSAERQNYENQLGQLKNDLSRMSIEKNILSETLIKEQEKNSMFEEQIRGIAGTVGILEKLSKTDKELLQKYSKVYFLNEHYLPSKIVQIEQKYVLGDKDKWIHASVWPFLKKLLDKAESQGVDLRVISAYRSFDEQADVKEGHIVTYGIGTANQFSAEQGYSEHQLGTTADFTTLQNGSNFGTFKNTEGYNWLLENSYKYGFILSYPEGNSYYQYEPWHWRFVGVELATDLHRDGEYFYDLDQRKIDEYLVSIFD